MTYEKGPNPMSTAANDELHRILDTAHRLEAMRTAPPQPLRHRHDRDEPDRDPEPFTAPRQLTGHIRASQRILKFDYHSKGLKP